MLFKTTEAQYPALEADLLERHPWDNPELCAVPVKFAAPRCAEWVRDSVTGAGA